MGSHLVLLLLLLFCIVSVHCKSESNSEADAPNAWRVQLTDPSNALMTWDATTHNPCVWLYITCNSHYSVVRVYLVNKGLSGPLVPQLGTLINLQYLVVSNNSLSGSIPIELGNLTSLISLDLQHNLFSRSIPSTLGKLTSLTTLLNSNQLTGRIPPEITRLKLSGSLTVMDVSGNHLEEEEEEEKKLLTFNLHLIIIMQERATRERYAVSWQLVLEPFWLLYSRTS